MDIEPALELLKVLADETRLKLVGLLAQQDRSVGELAEILALKEPTISHHLQRLLAAGLVRMRREGTVHVYRLDTEVFQTMGKDLFSEDQVNTLAAAAGGDAWEKKVLRTYLQDGELTKIPQTRKKRDVILRWLVTQFEAGREYPEMEVNAIIQQFHWDSATLRREMVGARLMDREAGIYWRTPERGKEDE